MATTTAARAAIVASIAAASTAITPVAATAITVRSVDIPPVAQQAPAFEQFAPGVQLQGIGQTRRSRRQEPGGATLWTERGDAQTPGVQ